MKQHGRTVLQSILASQALSCTAVGAGMTGLICARELSPFCLRQLLAEQL